MMQMSLSLPGFGAGTAVLEAHWKQPLVEAGLWPVPLPPSPTLLFQPLFGPLLCSSVAAAVSQPFSTLQRPTTSSCFQDGDPCIYCIFFWLYGGKESGSPPLLFSNTLDLSAPEPLNCRSYTGSFSLEDASIAHYTPLFPFFLCCVDFISFFVELALFAFRH